MTEFVNKTVLSRELLLEVLDQLPTPVYLKDENACFLASNIAHCKVSGKTNDELIGLSDFDLHTPERAAEFNAVDMEILRTGIPVEREEEILDAETGLQRYVKTHKAVLRDADGRVYLIGTNSDVTENHRRENQYKALTETVPVGVAQIDEALEIGFSNPLFNAYCGGDGTEVDRARLILKLRDANASFPGEACKFESVVQGLGNQPRTMIVISSGWLELGDKLRTATISLIDISQMAELQRINEDVSRLNLELAANVRKLSEAQDSLVKKGRMEQLGQLTATVAHELRNPLGAVRTSAFLLERKLKDKNLGIETQLGRINNGIVRCDNIITQLLDFSRTTELHFQPGDLDAWLTQIVEEEAKKLPDHVNVELSLGLDGQTVPFDPARLQRAIINMISNAVEAMTSATDKDKSSVIAEPRVSISTFIKSGHVSVRVKDNGPGIAPEVLARIREPLFTTKSFGTGLGVPAIEQIAIQHGGRMDVRSEVGVGSAFTVWLPLSRDGAKLEENAA
jgi:PAS domain S-box-containing protein